MILVDADLLLYAEDRTSPCHEPARQWWDEQLSGSDPVCLCWNVISAFLRIGTNPRVFERPLTLDEAADRVSSWFGQPCVRLIHSTGKHWDLRRSLLIDSQARRDLVTDAHLAALSIEHGCELCSTEADFARFRRLKWRNPLAAPRPR